MPNLPSSAVTRSALDFIKSGLRLVGALRSGINLDGGESADCLLVLNDMMDAFNSERAMIFTTGPLLNDQNGVPFTLIASQQAYTVGNALGTENLLTPRPPRLDRVSIMYSASQQTPIELPMDMYDDVQWQGIANKSTPSILPQVCYNDKGFPDMTLKFWPVPTQANPIVLYIWQALTQFPDLQTKFSFPPGYAEAIRFNLAQRFAAEFPCDLQKLPVVMKMASEAKDRLISFNSTSKEMVCDEALVGSYGKMGNIFTSSANRSQRY